MTPGPEHFRETFRRAFDPETAKNVKVYGIPVRSRVYKASAPDRHGRWWVSVGPTGTKRYHFKWAVAMLFANTAAKKERQRIFAIWEGQRR